MINIPIHIPIQKEERKKEESIRYPVHIVCVLREYSQYASLHALRDYCKECGIMFSTRIYDSKKYSDDCSYIERLPAFHAYVKRSYIKTFYPNTRPFQHVDETLEIHLKSVEAKRRRSELWRKPFKIMANWFKRINHRTTRMEKYEKEQYDKSSRRSSVSDWR